MQIRHTLNFALEGLRKHRERRAGWQWKSCQTIPPRDDQEEHRTAARVKAEGMRCRNIVRLYARRSAGKIYLVGKEGEDRFAILSFTRSIL